MRFTQGIFGNDPFHFITSFMSSSQHPGTQPPYVKRTHHLTGLRSHFPTELVWGWWHWDIPYVWFVSKQTNELGFMLQICPASFHRVFFNQLIVPKSPTKWSQRFIAGNIVCKWWIFQQELFDDTGGSNLPVITILNHQSPELIINHY